MLLCHNIMSQYMRHIHVYDFNPTYIIYHISYYVFFQIYQHSNIGFTSYAVKCHGFAIWGYSCGQAFYLTIISIILNTNSFSNPRLIPKRYSLAWASYISLYLMFLNLEVNNDFNCSS